MWQRTDPNARPRDACAAAPHLRVLPGGSASTNASLEGSSDSKSPGRALAVTGSCADVWSQKLCTKRSNDDKCNTKKVRQN
eukprot:scaffold133752_cov96-Phaeocystis_antarctica.AAC.1